MAESQLLQTIDRATGALTRSVVWRRRWRRSWATRWWIWRHRHFRQPGRSARGQVIADHVRDATQVRASDIHIEPQESKLQIRFRIDGVLHLQTEADNKIAAALVLRLKLTSGLDISEKRMPQDGRFNIKVRGSRLMCGFPPCRPSTVNRW